MSDPVSTASERQRALVFGAGGGIGGALLSQLATRNFEVIALTRRPIDNLAGLQLTVDIQDEASIATAAEVLAAGAPITRVFVATGLLHAPGLTPERSNAELDPGRLMRLFAINAVGPALVAKHFLPLLPKSGRAVFAMLSARVGSIGDNRLGGWHSYRASKAALNMLIRTLSIELVRTRPHAILVGLHPGTVDTGLSKPFQSRVPELFSPVQAADHLLAVTDALQLRDSGGVFAWDGRRIPE
jgi:NAD(P)-dependent dehydrogenase (short-subunit alcohol dehydrogenase family)